MEIRLIRGGMGSQKAMRCFQTSGCRWNSCAFSFPSKSLLQVVLPVRYSPKYPSGEASLYLSLSVGKRKAFQV